MPFAQDVVTRAVNVSWGGMRKDLMVLGGCWTSGGLGYMQVGMRPNDEGESVFTKVEAGAHFTYAPTVEDINNPHPDTELSEIVVVDDDNTIHDGTTDGIALLAVFTPNLEASPRPDTVAPIRIDVLNGLSLDEYKNKFVNQDTLNGDTYEQRPWNGEYSDPVHIDFKDASGNATGTLELPRYYVLPSPYIWAYANIVWGVVDDGQGNPLLVFLHGAMPFADGTLVIYDESPELAGYHVPIGEVPNEYGGQQWSITAYDWTGKKVDQEFSWGEHAFYGGNQLTAAGPNGIMGTRRVPAKLNGPSGAGKVLSSVLIIHPAS